MRYNRQRIDRERMLKGWTRRHLGELAGVSENMVGQFLNHSVGTPRTVKKLADALGLEMSAILEDDEVQSPSSLRPRPPRRQHAKT